MHIGYIQDRLKLGFICERDIQAGKLMVKKTPSIETLLFFLTLWSLTILMVSLSINGSLQRIETKSIESLGFSNRIINGLLSESRIVIHTQFEGLDSKIKKLHLDINIDNAISKPSTLGSKLLEICQSPLGNAFLLIVVTLLRTRESNFLDSFLSKDSC